MSKIRPRTPAKPGNTLNKSLAIWMVAVIISLSSLVLTWFNGCMSACSLKSFKWMTFKPRLWSWWKLKRGLGFLSLKNMTRTPWLNVTKEKNISEFFLSLFSQEGGRARPPRPQLYMKVNISKALHGTPFPEFMFSMGNWNSTQELP